MIPFLSTFNFEPYLKATNRSRRDERADNLTNSILYVNQNGTVESEPNEIEFTKNKPPINITNLEPETEYDFIITTSLNSKWKTSLNLDDIGQAHDMFSRIFRIRIYEFFLPNNICFDFSKCLKLSRKCLFWPICFLFQLRNIGEKIHRFLFWNSWKHVVNSIIATTANNSRQPEGIIGFTMTSSEYKAAELSIFSIIMALIALSIIILLFSGTL